MSASNTYLGNGAYAGSVSTTASGTAYAGEWIQIQSKIPIRPTSYFVSTKAGYSLPKTWAFVASMNGNTWDLIDSRFDNTFATWLVGSNIPVTTSSNYTHFRLVSIAVSGGPTYLYTAVNNFLIDGVPSSSNNSITVSPMQAIHTADQLLKTMYGALQKAMSNIDVLQSEVISLKSVISGLGN